MGIPVTAYSHVRLTVTDIERSRAFYDAVFAFDVAYEMPEDADEATREQLAFLFGGVIYTFGAGQLLGLRPAAHPQDRFDADRVGLDHVSFSVRSLADLQAAVATLDAAGVPHEPVKDIGGLSILEFRDPDGNALELIAPH
ncbi:MAG: glyoxalase [Frankiales bacterium]|jgi:glyoxylase I family protein|nr:glyoxalase [Frankiales bacterium]